MANIYNDNDYKIISHSDDKYIYVTALERENLNIRKRYKIDKENYDLYSY